MKGLRGIAQILVFVLILAGLTACDVDSQPKGKNRGDNPSTTPREKDRASKNKTPAPEPKDTPKNEELVVEGCDNGGVVAFEVVKDHSFEKNGKVVLRTCKAADRIKAKAMATQSDGKIVIAGTLEERGKAESRRFFFLRLNRDGKMDPTFVHKKGYQILPRDRNDDLHSMILSSNAQDADIYAAGVDKEDKAFLIHIESKGGIDETFNKNAAVAIPDVLARGKDESMRPPLRPLDHADASDLVSHYKARLVDNKFLPLNLDRERGKVETPIKIQHLPLARMSDGSILLGFRAKGKGASIARFKNDGKLDSKFGEKGSGIARIPDGSQLGKSVENVGFQAITVMPKDNKSRESIIAVGDYSYSESRVVNAYREDIWEALSKDKDVSIQDGIAEYKLQHDSKKLPNGAHEVQTYRLEPPVKFASGNARVWARFTSKGEVDTEFYKAKSADDKEKYGGGLVYLPYSRFFTPVGQVKIQPIPKDYRDAELKKIAGPKLPEPKTLNNAFVLNDFETGTRAVAVQPDGKIIVASYAHITPKEMTASAAVQEKQKDAKFKGTAQFDAVNMERVDGRSGKTNLVTLVERFPSSGETSATPETVDVLIPNFEGKSKSKQDENIGGICIDRGAREETLLSPEEAPFLPSNLFLLEDKVLVVGRTLQLPGTAGGHDSYVVIAAMDKNNLRAIENFGDGGHRPITDVALVDQVLSALQPIEGGAPKILTLTSNVLETDRREVHLTRFRTTDGVLDLGPTP